MNPKINSSNFPNYSIINKKINEKNILLDSNQLINKDLHCNQDHNNINSLFKVIQEEKESSSPNNFLYINSEKNSKNQSKNINIIKPKFVTRTMQSDNLKIKNAEEPSLNLNLSLNLSSSAFQMRDDVLYQKINTFFHQWNEITSFGCKYYFTSQNPQYYRFEQYQHDSFLSEDARRAFEKLTTMVIALQPAYREMIDYIKANYPDIDLDETSQVFYSNQAKI